ncbi:peptidoglycan bridge formation protein FemAB [Bifidobacterium pseudocatenulatum DSM 20438 = JCM 1200 = LMG 10505]|nr:peptidoglycan bridge formation protein FemAB [Bifidobacterium pseudocatenulatum DSM 20438 = JCM 1200 = LMG 10505]
MITLEFTDAATMEQQAVQAGLTLPIEQTAVWAKYQNTIDGRTPWGAYVVKQDGAPIAFIALIDYETHGYHYLRSVHGPAWLNKPSAQLEAQVRDLLVEDVRKRDKNVVFLRIDLWDFEGSFPVLSTVPYNETVHVDITGGDEAVLTRMKKRGRRDVRKALRESPAACADETAQAMADFSEYYEVMVDTAHRDGFSPAPMSDYVDMISNLGPDHARVFAARIDGKVVAWSIITINGDHAVYYYACMRTEIMRQHVPDKLIYVVCCALGERGLHCSRFDGHRQRFRAFIEEFERIQDEILREYRTGFGRS